MDALPPEVLSKIFDCLDYDDLRHVKCVNSYFSTLLEDKLLWKRIVLNGTIPPELYIPKLELAVDLSIKRGLPEISVLNLKSLKYLEIYCNYHFPHIQSFANSINPINCPNLERVSIYIESSDQNVLHTLYLCDKLLALGTLKSFEVRLAQGAQVDIVTNKLDIILTSGGSRLTELKLDYFPLDALFEINTENLETVDIKELKIYRTELDVSKMQMFTSLRCLHLGLTGFLSSVSSIAKDILQNLNDKMEEISIKTIPRNEFFSLNCYNILANRIERMNHLRILEIDRPKMRYDYKFATLPLGSPLGKNCPNIEKLSVPGFPLPGDLEELTLRRLNSFSIDGVVDVSGLKALRRNCKRLQSLSISYGCLNAKEWKQLSKLQLTSLLVESPDIEFTEMQIFFDVGGGIMLRDLHLLTSNLKLQDIKIRSISTRCPNLERLSIDIQDSKIETNTYIHILSNCKRLKVLNLKTKSLVNKVVIAKFKSNNVALNLI